jgi:GNAT superfamily N-acetyltransferase
MTDLKIRRATLDDIEPLRSLIARSARELGAGDYSSAQIEGALSGAFGVDTQLLHDGTYFVVEHAGQLAGCGGWSRRRTLFGSDARQDRDATELDPRVDAAKIRAFFVYPEFTRRGVGTAILDRCERDACAQGFVRFELMATLPGVRLYAARGYIAAQPIQWRLSDSLSIEFIPMHKQVAVVRRVEAAEPGLMPALCELLQDSVHCGASVGFLAPLSRDRAQHYWNQVMQSLGESLRLWVAQESGSVVGAVQIAPCTKENGRHRADLQKLLVLSSHRGRGIGSALMAAAEDSAASSGLSLLVLDTLRGSTAEGMYTHLGWARAGEIPGYAASPDGELHPTVYFYKVISPKVI